MNTFLNFLVLHNVWDFLSIPMAIEALLNLTITGRLLSVVFLPTRETVSGRGYSSTASEISATLSSILSESWSSSPKIKTFFDRSSLSAMSFTARSIAAGVILILLYFTDFDELVLKNNYF